MMYVCMYALCVYVNMYVCMYTYIHHYYEENDL